LTHKFDPPSLGGAKYVLTFLDDYSRFATVKFLKHKAEVPKYIRQYRSLNENKFGVKMGQLKMDNGGEHIGEVFENDLRNNGIEHIKSCPRCPELNGRSERLNRSLMEMARCIVRCAQNILGRGCQYSLLHQE